MIKANESEAACIADLSPAAAIPAQSSTIVASEVNILLRPDVKHRAGLIECLVVILSQLVLLCCVPFIVTTIDQKVCQKAKVAH